MKLAVLSDIHSNLEAFRRVLEDIDNQGVTEIVSLGDNVGYGPEPEAVVALVRERGIPSVQGNHELGLVRRKDISWFNPTARQALRRTRELVSESSLAWCATLPPYLVRHGCRFVHGFPPDSARLYLFACEDGEVVAAMDRIAERVCFVGHTHDLELVTISGGAVERAPLPHGPTRLDTTLRYIVNIGSVGQPRDGDNRAKYVLWEPESGLVTVRRVAYDIAVTAEKILALGIPAQYANRLW